MKEFAELIIRLDQSNKTSDKLEAMGQFFAKAADSDNLLLKQAHEEAINQQMEKDKLMLALEKINRQKIEVKYPVTPLLLPFRSWWIASGQVFHPKAWKLGLPRFRRSLRRRINSLSRRMG